MKRQLLLFKSESPFNERFSAEFFKAIPTSAGVYYFRDSYGNLLYVGKAKNLKRRISSYRQIKFGKSSKKLLRLVSETCNIAWESCDDEKLALLRENALLRTYKPQFNRMNVWPENYVYLHVYKSAQDFFVIADRELNPQATRTYGAFKSKKFLLPKVKSLLRLLKFSTMNQYDKFGTADKSGDGNRLDGISANEQVSQRNLDPEAWEDKGYFFVIADPYIENDFYAFLKGESDQFINEIQGQLEKLLPRDSFVNFMLRQDLLIAAEFFASLKRNLELIEMAGLTRPYILKSEVDDLRVMSRPRTPKKSASLAEAEKTNKTAPEQQDQFQREY